MKAFLLPAACVLALVIMGGAVVTHRLGLAERVTQAQLLATSGESPAPATTPPSATKLNLDSDALSFLRRIETQLAKVATQVEQLDKHVETADRVQQDLRDQVAETNRDLMEIQFRVDSHSREFRPLRSVQDSPYADTPGVLPPREVSP